MNAVWRYFCLNTDAKHKCNLCRKNKDMYVIKIRIRTCHVAVLTGPNAHRSSIKYRERRISIPYFAFSSRRNYQPVNKRCGITTISQVTVGLLHRMLCLIVSWWRLTSTWFYRFPTFPSRWARQIVLQRFIEDNGRDGPHNNYSPQPGIHSGYAPSYGPPGGQYVLGPLLFSFLDLSLDMDHLLDHLLAGSYMFDIDQRPWFTLAFLAMVLLQVLRPLGKFK